MNPPGSATANYRLPEAYCFQVCASVICQSIPVTHTCDFHYFISDGQFIQCTTGEIRLVGGSHPNEGKT